MINFHIRQYEEKDNPHVKELHVLALKFAYGYFEHGPWDEDLDRIPEIYLKGGDFLVGVFEEKIIAMGALKKASEDTGEIKRMRVHPDFQRNGIGQLFLDKLEAKAKQLGYKILQLDTTVKQIGAQKLYEKNGYREVRRETEG